MAKGIVYCVYCRTALSPGMFNTSTYEACPACRSKLRVDVFPALYRDPPQGRPAETAVLDEESTCFYHDAKKAVVACENCGRFLCDLCDIELRGKHLCPRCLEMGAAEHKVEDIETSRSRHDVIALRLTLWPLLGGLFVFVLSPVASQVFTLFFAATTAPIALLIIFFRRNSPCSLVRSGCRTRLRIAAFLAFLHIFLAVVIILRFLS